MPGQRLPRYEEIASHLRELVAAGNPGDRLPSEPEICREFGVSRMTARHAIQQLELEHLVVRKRGKGTFIGQPPVPRLLGSPLSFTESMRRRGLTATSDLVAAAAADPSADDVKALGIAADDRVYVLERIRLADGIPMAIERAVIAPDCGDVVAALDGGSLHDAFEAAGRIPAGAVAQVTARSATEEECRLLDLEPGGVVLCEKRVIHDQAGKPLEHTETRYAADRYVFDVTLGTGEGATA